MKPQCVGGMTRHEYVDPCCIIGIYFTKKYQLNQHQSSLFGKVSMRSVESRLYRACVNAVESRWHLRNTNVIFHRNTATIVMKSGQTDEQWNWFCNSISWHRSRCGDRKTKLHFGKKVSCLMVKPCSCAVTTTSLVSYCICRDAAVWLVVRCSDVTWVAWCHRLSVTRPSFQQFVQAVNKGNIEVVNLIHRCPVQYFLASCT